MPLDPRLEALRTLLAQDQDLSVPHDERRRAGRERTRANKGRFSSVGPDMETRDLVVPTAEGGVPIRLYRPADGVLPLFVNIHGGGWWTGSIEESDGGCRREAAALGCAMVAIDYRLAPEHPFPAGLDDCDAVVRWVVEHADELGIDPDRVLLGGGSAGANLATGVALRFRDHGGPAVVGLLLESPGLDLTDLGTPSMREYADGYGFTMESIKECIDFYVQDHDPADPLVSPVFGDLGGLPRTLVTTMQCDPFCDGAELFASRMAEAGGDVTLRRFDGMAHGCATLDMVVPEVAAAYRELAHGFVREALSL